MPAYAGYVSCESCAGQAQDSPADILVCAPNWLGDGIMSMPAVQALKRVEPGGGITVLVKTQLAALWQMHAAPDAIIPYVPTFSGTLDAAAKLKALRFRKALIFPNSHRAALMPFLAGVPARIGLGGHGRAWLLTHRAVRPGPDDPARAHQAWEYMAVAGLAGAGARLETPRLSVRRELAARFLAEIGTGSGERIVGVMPGAARGPSKRWPAAHFVETARIMMRNRRVRFLVLGGPGEAALCAEVAGGIGARARSLAGRTSLQELAALLAACSAVIANDSGGMHLASAAGAKVAAVFGMTDPGKTGPLGEGHRVISDDTVARSREIARRSRAAQDALAAISPDRAAAAAIELMEET